MAAICGSVTLWAVVVAPHTPRTTATVNIDNFIWNLLRPEGNSSRTSGRPEPRAALFNGVAKRREVTLSDSREHRRDDPVAPRLMERERGWSGHAGAIQEVATKR